MTGHAFLLATRTPPRQLRGRCGGSDMGCTMYSSIHFGYITTGTTYIRYRTARLYYTGKQPLRRCAVSPVEPRFLGPFAPPPSPRHGSRRARWWGLTGSLTGPGIRTPAPDGDRHSGRSRGFSGCLRQGAVRTEHRKSVVNFFINTASSSFHCRRLHTIPRLLRPPSVHPLYAHPPGIYGSLRLRLGRR
jgi:hypothetical protein